MLLQVERLVAGYEKPVFSPASFSLAQGEIIGLSGANGSGKTTLLAALLGRARVFSGHIRTAPGAIINQQSQHQPALEGIPLSGRELLALTGADAAAARLPTFLGANKLGDGREKQWTVDQRLDRLSGGQRQFLYLWACLQAPANIILLDEPTNNLDQSAIRHLIPVLRERVADGAGMIVVSHDPAFLAEVCGRIVTLDSGESIA